MSLKKTSFLILISFFPIFAFRSNLNLIEITIVSVIFLSPILILNYFLILKNFLKKKILNFYFATIIAFGIDNNLGLWNGIIEPSKLILFKYFDIIYYPGIILLVTLILLIFFLLSFTEKKFFNVVIVFLVTISIFNVFDQTKNYKKVKDFKNSDELTFDKTDVIIVFDEMSGLNSFSSQTDEGREFDVLAKKLFKEFNFVFYSDIKSISENSVSSLSSLLNFSESKDLRLEVVKESKNYFYEYELIKSLLFEKFKSISIYQNIHIDYCVFDNVKKCKTYNPFNQKKYLNGYKDTFSSKIISLWKLNGSIFSTIIWRTLRELRLIDSNLEPEGHKASFEDFFDNLEEDISSNEFDLIFAHTLVPHKPYGFKKNCDYDGGLSTRNIFYSVNKHVGQHNIERKCVLNFLRNFLENLQKKQLLDEINLTILSDHGSRIIKEENSLLSVIYAFRNEKTKFFENKEQEISQNIFLKKYN